MQLGIVTVNYMDRDFKLWILYLTTREALSSCLRKRGHNLSTENPPLAANA